MNQRSRDVSPGDTVRGNIISTGQRATGQGVTFGFGLTPALSRRREREIWCFFPAMSGIRVDETAMGEY
jgi:hypothetical protein